MKMNLRLPGLSRTNAGLVIRADEVEVLRLDGARVTAQARVPVAGADTLHLTAAIRQAVASAQVSSGALAVSISAHDVLVRCFPIPLVPKAEWAAAIRFEARKYIPFKPESLIWTYHVVAPPLGSASQQLEVVFLAIQQERFRRLEAALAAAGVQPTLMEPHSVSLARLVQHQSGTDAHAYVCAVELTRQGAHVAIIRAGVPYLARDLRALSAEPPPGSERQAPPADASAELLLERLPGEVNVSTKFFLREHPGARIQQVVLFGAEPLVSQARDGLVERLAFPVEVGTALLQRLAGDAAPSASATAVGLVSPAGRAGRPWCDFLNARRSEATTTRWLPHVRQTIAEKVRVVMPLLKEPQLISLAACLTLGLIGWWVISARHVARHQRELQAVTAALPSMQQGLATLDQDQLLTLEERATSQLAALRRMFTENIGLARMLDGLARSLPEGVWLMDLSFTGQVATTASPQATLNIRGACFLGQQGSGDEQEAIYQFEDQLKRHPAFANGFGAVQLDRVEANIDQNQQSTYRTFELHCTPRDRNTEQLHTRQLHTGHSVGGPGA